MKKILVAVATFLMLGVANAGIFMAESGLNPTSSTVNLAHAGCNANCACSAVSNDGGLEITQTTWFYAYGGVPYILDMTINGEHYTAADRSGVPLAGVWLYGPNGEQVLATVNFHRWSTKGGRYYIQHCEVTNGTLQFP